MKCFSLPQWHSAISNLPNPNEIALCNLLVPVIILRGIYGGVSGAGIGKISKVETLHAMSQLSLQENVSHFFL